MTNTRIYIRRSNDEQSTFSIEAQERQCRIWCDLHGYQVCDVYIDDDASGRRDDRPNFRRLVRDATNDRGSIVVVHKIDRLARKALTTLQVIQDFEAHHVTLNSVHENMDFSTPYGLMVLTSLASFAEFYSRNLATEITKGLREKFARGGVVGDVSYGYVRQWQTNSRGESIRGTV